MDFDIQLLIALVATCAIGIPITLYKYKKYRKEGRSIKYLASKVAIVVAIPVMLVLVLLQDELSLTQKLVAVIAALISMVVYAYVITAARKSFRKILGLSPEDEHTGEVMKEDKKKK